MILLFASDLHGRAGHYRALRMAAEAVRPGVLVLGGDLFPDDPADDPASMGTHQPVYVAQEFRPWLAGLLRDLPGLSVLTIFGNRDWSSAAAAMEEEARKDPRLRILQHDRAVEVGGLWFVGYSKTPPTAWYVKDFERLDLPGDYPPAMGGARWDPERRRALPGRAKDQFARYPTMQEELEKMVRPAGPWVFVAHAPPHDTVLDRTFQRDSVGSRAIRAAVESRQPLLALHGHVHESPDVTGEHLCRLGAATAVNVGQHIEALSFAVIEVDQAAGRIVGVERRRSS